MFECNDCGYKTENAPQDNMCPVCRKPMEPVIVLGEPGEKKKGNGIKGVLCTLLVVFLIRIVGAFVVEKMIDNTQEHSIKKDMDKFVEKVEEYEPGKFSSSGYESEYLGVRWEPETPWKKMSETELSEIKSIAEESVTKATKDAIEKEDIPKDIKDKLLSTVYGDVEAGYIYVKDDEISGYAYLMIYSIYGTEKATAEKGIFDGAKSKMLNPTIGEVSLGNKKYQYVDGGIKDVAVNGNMRMYVRSDGVMLSVFQVLYLDGCDEVIESFEKSISSY